MAWRGSSTLLTDCCIDVVVAKIAYLACFNKSRKKVSNSRTNKLICTLVNVYFIVPITSLLMDLRI